MPTLSGQSISNTYDGLLKLQDSTQGISPSLQPIEDGLGNNTGSRIGTNLFTAPNVVGMYMNNLKPDFMGSGISANLYTPANESINNLVFTIFYDTGVHSYSALTLSVASATTNADVVELLFYDLQFIKDYGLYPRNKIMGGIMLPTTSTGYQTISLPSTLSFSGQGGGPYCLVLKITNSGGAPTVRYRTRVLSSEPTNFLTASLGYVLNPVNNLYTTGSRVVSLSGANSVVLLGQSTPDVITESDILSRFIQQAAGGALGVLLNVIK